MSISSRWSRNTHKKYLFKTILTFCQLQMDVGLVGLDFYPNNVMPWCSSARTMDTLIAACFLCVYPSMPKWSLCTMCVRIIAVTPCRISIAVVISSKKNWGYNSTFRSVSSDRPQENVHWLYIYTHTLNGGILSWLYSIPSRSVFYHRERITDLWSFLYGFINPLLCVPVIILHYWLRLLAVKC